MWRLILFVSLFVAVLAVFTQIGWLSNGFYGFRLLIPVGSGWAVVAGVMIAFLTLWLLKIARKFRA